MGNVPLPRRIGPWAQAENGDLFILSLAHRALISGTGVAALT
jgi:hypothetical protein